MSTEIAPKDLARAAGISPSFASQILSGVRKPSSAVALEAFRMCGVRLGLLAEMTDSDIRKLCGECFHTPLDAPDAAGVSAYKNSQDSTCAAPLREAGAGDPHKPAPVDGAVQGEAA